MSRGMFARIRWETPPAVSPLETLGEPSPKSALAAMLERTKVPRHPQGDAATVRDEAVFLLQAASEVEHQFIVQYLYAAFSLDVAGSPPEISRWANRLRQIAREEMGHLMTVQNVLLCLGAEPYVERQTNPPPEPLPFPLSLEPFGLPFVKRFLVAESPADPEALPAELRDLKEGIDHVGALYAMLYWLFQDSDARVCPWFLPADVPFPAGRHLAESDYSQPGELAERINQPDDWSVFGAIHILPDRTQSPMTNPQEIADAARQALFDVALQGEGPNDPGDDPSPCQPPPQVVSHYQMLLEIYQQVKATEEAGGTISVRPVPTDPQVSQITNLAANRLARAADLRYALLMLEIGIAVFTRRSTVVEGERLLETVARWALEDMTLGIREMGAKLVTLPRTQDGTAADGVAALPFTVPAPFPGDERGRWERLIELLDAFAAVLQEPVPSGSDPEIETILNDAAGTDEQRRQLAAAVLTQLS